MRILDEASRRDLLAKSKASQKGKQRYNRRNKSSIMKSTREMNDIDMNALFKDGILTVCLQVHGETNDYIVKIKFGGFLDEVRKLVKEEFDLNIRNITRAIISCFNNEETYIHCSCPDFKYRFDYWATVNDFTSGPEQHSNGQWIRNPSDDLGSACKHVLLVLSNNRWIQTVARVIYNYIQYIKSHKERLYAEIIYPAVFRKKYSDAVQQDMFDDNTLDKRDIRIANDERRTSTQFQKGNKQGVRFASDKMDRNQLTLFGNNNNNEEPKEEEKNEVTLFGDKTEDENKLTDVEEQD